MHLFVFWSCSIVHFFIQLLSSFCILVLCCVVWQKCVYQWQSHNPKVAWCIHSALNGRRSWWGAQDALFPCGSIAVLYSMVWCSIKARGKIWLKPCADYRNWTEISPGWSLRPCPHVPKWSVFPPSSLASFQEYLRLKGSVENDSTCCSSYSSL